MSENKVYKYLGFAARARSLAVGATAVQQSVRKRKAKLVIIGKEVGNNTIDKLAPICKRYDVRFIVYGNCDMLSHATGKVDKGIFALEDENLARAIIEEIDKSI